MCWQPGSRTRVSLLRIGTSCYGYVLKFLKDGHVSIVSEVAAWVVFVVALLRYAFKSEAVAGVVQRWLSSNRVESKVLVITEKVGASEEAAGYCY